jgi:hypothetical protein
MVFSETIIPTGKILYKGLGQKSCGILLRDTRSFYLTDSVSQAKEYGNTCKFRVKKTLRLFDLSHPNISKLLTSKYPISESTRHLLKVSVGTGITVGQQARAAKLIFGKNAGTLPRNSNKRPGQRLSYTELNKMVFGNLTREFLIPEGYDGYYAPTKKSIFHSGSFHSEIMINNAYQSIERLAGNTRMPVVSHRSFKWGLPAIFLQFCKGSTRLTRPYGGGLTIFCTGGMAVRLYMQARKQKLTGTVRRTSDFDFTFAIPGKLTSEKKVSSYVFSMRRIMTAHLNAFIRYLNRNFKGINARLKVTTFGRSPADNPRVQIPGTGRKIYQVITYQVVTGKNEVTDLVDTALAVYPGASRSMLHLPFSYKIGIPVQRLRYQLKDTLALLSGSIIHKGLISQRNPITGKKKEKGAKNLERAAGLLKIVGASKKYYKNLTNLAYKALPLIESVANKNIKKARVNARVVNRAIRKIK